MGRKHSRRKLEDISGGVTGAEPPLEGVARNKVRAQGKAFPSPKFKFDL